jgi:lipoprotein-anchoring transpeptidase ErfK/SrfK
MRGKKINTALLLFFFIIMPIGSYAFDDEDTSSHINSPGEKVIVVDPRIHTWAAYDANGTLVRSGTAAAGADWCKDMDSSCHTDTGSFRIRSLGDGRCVSPSFPMPHGGAPMPYCMYFTQYQALHGSYEVVKGNISHGCVRLHVSDAKWLRYNFAEIGTLVIIKSY